MKRNKEEYRDTRKKEENKIKTGKTTRKFANKKERQNVKSFLKGFEK